MRISKLTDKFYLGSLSEFSETPHYEEMGINHELFGITKGPKKIRKVLRKGKNK